jgi:hypothetical protein
VNAAKIEIGESGGAARISGSRFTHHVSRLTLAHRPALLSLLLLSLLYLGALVALPPDALTHHDTGAKYLQVRNLRLEPLGIDWSINYPARPLDPEVRFAPFNPKQHTVDDAGRIYLQWPIFLGLLTRIPWKVMGFWGLYLIPFLAGLGTAWLAYRLALGAGVPKRVAWVAVPALGLATPLFAYSLLYFEHTLAALLVTGSLLAGALAAGMENGSKRLRLDLLSAGLLSISIYFRSELYILALVTFGALAWRSWREHEWRAPLLWLGTFALGLVPLWGFYALKEGTILPLHATWYFAGSSGGEGAASGGIELPRLRYLATAGLRVVPDFLFGPQHFPLSPRYPFWVEAAGLVGVGLCAIAALGRFLRVPAGWRLGMLLGGLLLTLAPALVTLFLPDPYYNLHGFLTASPFIILALWPSEPRITQDDPATQNSKLKTQNYLRTVTLTYVGIHALVISALSGLGPISRHEWGQRYLLPAYPALAVLALLAGWQIWTLYGDQFRRLAVAGLATVAAMLAVGVGLEARGYVMLREERAQVGEWLALVRTLPGREPLITDVWWLPLNLAADFYTRPMMLAEGEARLREWAAQMRARGVESFGLMSQSDTYSSALFAPQGYLPEGTPQQARGMWLQRYRLVGP